MARQELSGYDKVIQKVFFDNYEEGSEEVKFSRSELERAPDLLGIKDHKNLGDIPYSYRYRKQLPKSIRDTAPEGRDWVVLPDGDAKYAFKLWALTTITSTTNHLQIKIPDSTPGLIDRYAMSDEQALLAILRYNRLIDIFLNMTCYHLQSHLRTKVRNVGQIEIDDLYIGVKSNGVHYLVTVQAKGKNDKLSTVQFWQDAQFAKERRPELVSMHVGAAFLANKAGVVLYSIVESEDEMMVADEQHFRLVPSSELSEAEVRQYKKLTLG